MKIKTKKILAREFLFLLSSIILFFMITFLWLFLVNNNNKKINEIENNIEIVQNKLASQINLMEEKRTPEKEIEKMVKNSDEIKTINKLFSPNKIETTHKLQFRFTISKFMVIKFRTIIIDIKKWRNLDW